MFHFPKCQHTHTFPISFNPIFIPNELLEFQLCSVPSFPSSATVIWQQFFFFALMIFGLIVLHCLLGCNPNCTFGMVHIPYSSLRASQKCHKTHLCHSEGRYIYSSTVREIHASLPTMPQAPGRDESTLAKLGYARLKVRAIGGKPSKITENFFYVFIQSHETIGILSVLPACPFVKLAGFRCM